MHFRANSYHFRLRRWRLLPSHFRRQFEDPDDQLCYIETHDKTYCGHFLLRRVDFTPPKLSIEIERPRQNFVSVTFAMVATEFAEASHVVKIISGEIEPPDARAAKSMSLLRDWRRLVPIAKRVR